jgi:hypothetical protein
VLSVFCQEPLERNRVRDLLLTEILTCGFWNKDDDTLAMKVAASLENVLCRMDANCEARAACQTMVALVGKLDDKKPLKYFMDLRVSSKGGQRLLQHFTGLPVMVTKLAALDKWILDAKKDQTMVNKIADLQKELTNPSSTAVLKSGDADKIKVHFSALKKKALHILVLCGSDAASNREEQLQALCEEFDKVVCVIASNHISLWDSAFGKAVTVAMVAMHPEAFEGQIVDPAAALSGLEAHRHSIISNHLTPLAVCENGSSTKGHCHLFKTHWRT